LLQELTDQQLNSIRRYTKHVNIGTENRGTAILAKEEINLTDIKCLPSGRGMAANFQGTCIINLYAPSGAEKKQEREQFYNKELAYLLPITQPDLILAGDFNCVLPHYDTAGQRNYSEALGNLVTELGLSDVGQSTTTAPSYTHYTTTGASRLDRIYRMFQKELYNFESL
jgi:exonuclease III